MERPDLVKRIRRRFQPAWQHVKRAQHDLRMLVFELTQRCNLTCRHCGSDCKRSSTQDDLPFDTVVRVLTEVRTAHPDARVMVMMGGGEPLLYPRVFELGAKARELGFSWGMVTNGSLWDDAAFKAARKARMSSVSVSLDGPPGEHEWLRGPTSSYDTTLATIRRFNEATRGPAMDVITCVSPHNLPHLEELHEILCGLPVPGWRLIPISPIGRAKRDPDLLLDREGFRALLQKVVAFRRLDRIPVYLSESNYVGPCLEPLVRDQEYFCRAGVNIAGVMVNGDILACANIDRRFAQGNVHRDSFVETWEHGFQPFRDRRWMRKGACVGCGEWKYCLGNSFHNWDLDADAPALCQFRAFDLGALDVPDGPPIRRRAPGPQRRDG